VPFLSPWLSSHWIRLVTRANWPVARELVSGLTADLLAVDAAFWERIGHPAPLRFEEAARRALSEERAQEAPGGFWGAEEQWVARLHRAAGPM
jgi:hypothetical protein